MYAPHKRNLSKIRPVVFPKLDFEVDGIFSKSGNLFFTDFVYDFPLIISKAALRKNIEKSRLNI